MFGLYLRSCIYGGETNAATIKPDYRSSLCIFLLSGNGTPDHYRGSTGFHQIVTLKFRETHRRSAAVAWQRHPYDLKNAAFRSHDLHRVMICSEP